MTKRDLLVPRVALLQGIRPVTRAGAVRDALAGVQLAAMNIPQVLGYAKIAGMPVVTGCYTLLLPLLAFAALGSSRFLVVAADSATAAVLAGGISGMAPLGSNHGHVTNATDTTSLTKLISWLACKRSAAIWTRYRRRGTRPWFEQNAERMRRAEHWVPFSRITKPPRR